ncbi:hypothetical protein KSP39_PZI022276 [Platanthera zijinensis]|uniref:Uncharacterized protein n=1 Tax=Platanthera zijinensis TaxID=2320716 RepID=A0AAP0AWX9_9ASPA
MILTKLGHVKDLGQSTGCDADLASIDDGFNFLRGTGKIDLVVPLEPWIPESLSLERSENNAALMPTVSLTRYVKTSTKIQRKILIYYIKKDLKVENFEPEEHEQQSEGNCIESTKKQNKKEPASWISKTEHKGD